MAVCGRATRRGESAGWQQDFHLLEPDEANDDAGIPLWLRVHWRKAHSDMPHPKSNPGAGYPDVLYNIYAWILAHPELPWGIASDPTKGGRK